MSSSPAIGSTAAESTARRSATYGSVSSPEEPWTWTANPAASRAALTGAKCARLRQSTAVDEPAGSPATHSVSERMPTVRNSSSWAPEDTSTTTSPGPAPGLVVSGVSREPVSPSATRLATVRMVPSLRQLVLRVSGRTSVKSVSKRIMLSALAPRHP
ncbi:Uncharacterised protein [Mycobacteroides abscessus subsp. abscessus]|nr:Uncharacterised protein [Mycobacteroides abscessus subsp. abscessus]